MLFIWSGIDQQLKMVSYLKLDCKVNSGMSCFWRTNYQSYHISQGEMISSVMWLVTIKLNYQSSEWHQWYVKRNTIYEYIYTSLILIHYQKKNLFTQSFNQLPLKTFNSIHNY